MVHLTLVSSFEVQKGSLERTAMKGWHDEEDLAFHNNLLRSYCCCCTEETLEKMGRKKQEKKT